VRSFVANVSVRGGARNRDESLPKFPEILIKVPKLRIIVLRKILEKQRYLKKGTNPILRR
jgi:hypothetical protein